MERLGKPKIERIENLIDPNTKKLILLFRIINAGRFIGIPEFGEMKESVVLAGLLHGIRKGEVEFDWLNGKQIRQRSLVGLINGGGNFKVRVALDERLLQAMEQDVDAVGGALPIYGKTENVFGKLRKVNRKNHWRIRGWDEVTFALITAYAYYRHI